jgi:hypothetical protein
MRNMTRKIIIFLSVVWLTLAMTNPATAQYSHVWYRARHASE